MIHSGTRKRKNGIEVNCSFFTLIPFLDCSIKTTCPSLRNYAITGDTGREVLAQYDFRRDATREGCLYGCGHGIMSHLRH